MINALEKPVIRELLDFASKRQTAEYRKWIQMPECTPVSKTEAQRLKVASWATAVQAFYNQLEQKETHQNGIKGTTEVALS